MQFIDSPGDTALFEIDPSDLFVAMSRREKIIPVDARERFAYATEHIPGAVNIPHREMNEETTSGRMSFAVFGG